MLERVRLPELETLVSGSGNVICIFPHKRRWWAERWEGVSDVGRLQLENKYLAERKEN